MCSACDPPYQWVNHSLSTLGESCLFCGVRLTSSHSCQSIPLPPRCPSPLVDEGFMKEFLEKMNDAPVKNITITVAENGFSLTANGKQYVAVSVSELADLIGRLTKVSPS